jgi:hypothetical protein
MFEVLRALKQSAQLEALLERQVVKDDLERNTVGCPRQVLHLRKVEQQARRDTLQQLEIGLRQSRFSPAHLGSRSETGRMDSLYPDEKRIIYRLGRGGKTLNRRLVRIEAKTRRLVPLRAVTQATWPGAAVGTTIAELTA